jgi:hypothetical protein
MRWAFVSNLRDSQHGVGGSGAVLKPPLLSASLIAAEISLSRLAKTGMEGKERLCRRLKALHNPKLLVPFLTDKVLQHCPEAGDGYPAGRCISA